ncbi:hypothetical protein [Frigoriglobus tundricola]|uniref:Fibronectin type-III domain-containing protein n=1 Tax=Frigoriglobus tundricola TaxID=2774151 RepID=A0A6M5YW20_9BACT|nr:hypothetical protein [Frigoriglobus tundricola]QJW97403.1 hypothetical protein FTUN_4977 [Frigoriglobus tundricola]
MRLVSRFAVALGLFVVLASSARPQDPFGGLQPHYQPHRTFGIPVNGDEIAKLAAKPTHLQLYYSASRGPFQKGQKLPLNGLQAIGDGKKGFLFEAPRDGDYEFAVQFTYTDGSVSPKTDALAPEIRAIIDTVPPRVQLAPLGTGGVEWSATDDNLDPQYVSLQCKWPSDAKWTKITDRPFRPRDNYAWKIGPGQVLEVRVIAKDRAGNEGVSPVVRIPAESGVAVGLPKNTGPTWAGAAALPQPRIDYVNTLEFNVDYTVQRMGRSGVQAAHLFVLKDRGSWEPVKRYPVKLMPDDKGPHSLSLPYTAAQEGIYGFYIIPESGAGKKADDPKKDDQPMVNVVVDKTPPYVKITGVQVKPGGARGPLVEITWDAEDPNLMPQPVSLEWSLDKSAAKWNEVKYRLDNTPNTNTGRFTWEVPDEKLWKFWLRARAVDKAANVGESVWPNEVIVDLEQPSATIDRVRGGPSGAPAPKAPEKPPEPEKRGSDQIP